MIGKWRFVTHWWPHLDEIVAMWLIIKYGQDKFPGVSIADITYWDAGPRTKDGRSETEWFANGYILLGVGGGRFDEHPSAKGEPRKEGCSATLVAKYLRVDRRPELKQLLEYVRKTDTSGEEVEYGLNKLVANAHRSHPSDPETVIQDYFGHLDDILAIQQEFHSCGSEMAQAKIGTVGKYRIVAAITDKEQFSKYAMSGYGNNCDLVVVRRSSGQTAVLRNNATVSDDLMDRIAATVRWNEMARRGQQEALSYEQLIVEGSVASSRCWHYAKTGKMRTLLNGGASAPGVEPSWLTLEMIVKCLELAIKEAR